MKEVRGEREDKTRHVTKEKDWVWRPQRREGCTVKGEAEEEARFREKLRRMQSSGRS